MKAILYIICVLTIISCSRNRKKTEILSKDAICISKAGDFPYCKTFELKLNKGKFIIDNNGKYHTYNGKTGKIPVYKNCLLTSSQFIENNNKLILFNNYECGPEGYNDVTCINSNTCKTLWTINDYFGFTPNFFKIGNDIIIPGHCTIGKFNINSGKEIWRLDIEKKYEFSRIETCSINGEELKITGAASILNGWKLIDVFIDLRTGKENNPL